MAYLRDQFYDYLTSQGNNSPGAYINGLQKIEEIFGVDIDAEYDKDKAQNLFNLIQEVRKNPERIGQNANNLKQYSSRLTKYIMFRDGEDIVNKPIAFNFDWTDFYQKFADKLLEYKDDRSSLIRKIKNVFEKIGKPLPKLDNNNVIDIDPFSVFALFNKGITDINRTNIINGIIDEFNIDAVAPTNYDGIPVMNNMRATFYLFDDRRKDNDIPNIWKLFVSAMDYANTNNEKEGRQFKYWFDVVTKQELIKWNITMGLYWIRPWFFINLDARNRNYIEKHYETLFPPILFGLGETLRKSDDMFSSDEYVNCIKIFKKGFEHSVVQSAYNVDGLELISFPAISFDAWNDTFMDSDNEKKEELEFDNSKKYWLYAPGENAFKWEDCLKNNCIYLGWGGLSDLRQYSSKEDMRLKIQELYGDDSTQTNSALATWQFSNEMRVGDIVIVKKGMHKLIGLGEITSDYILDLAATDTYAHTRKVNWLNVGEWEHPGQAVMKTLTDITRYPDYVKQLLDIIQNNISVETPQSYSQIYTKNDFLNEVYIDENKYDTLVAVLDKKKNIILQGAPGVGKTYAAKRLAYSIIGAIDSDKIEMVQFHQSYSYEDFIMGYRPTSEGGFRIEYGPFYNFCKKAEQDLDSNYYFIIDEINRGNLSKIFGELFMLVENDKRGEELKLLYSDEKFSVPENVYIIGMMNTADRSLAMMDYALRRRFAFVEFEPAFENEKFKEFVASKNNDKFINLINLVKQINNDIENDETLGRGFRIGHSYFCLKGEIDDADIKSIVDFEIVPLLEEYWYDEKTTVDKWESRLGNI